MHVIDTGLWKILDTQHLTCCVGNVFHQAQWQIQLLVSKKP